MHHVTEFGLLHGCFQAAVRFIVDAYIVCFAILTEEEIFGPTGVLVCFFPSARNHTDPVGKAVFIVFVVEMVFVDFQFERTADQCGGDIFIHEGTRPQILHRGGNSQFCQRAAVKGLVTDVFHR